MKLDLWIYGNIEIIKATLFLSSDQILLVMVTGIVKIRLLQMDLFITQKVYELV